MHQRANGRETAIRFVIDAFNGRVDAILSRSKHDNYGTLEQEIKDGFSLVNLNGDLNRFMVFPNRIVPFPNGFAAFRFGFALIPFRVASIRFGFLTFRMGFASIPMGKNPIPNGSCIFR
ncbi:MAG: hypothetical protein RL616_2700 [Verrucomicrobiota bacterium]